MAAEKATALVLRTIDFSETSVVVTLFTREFGKISGLAKGGRRLKGPFESALDVLSLIRVVFLRKSSDALELLTEAKLERRFRASEAGLAGLNAAYYVAELLRELTHDNDPHPELFDAADCTLLALGRSRGAAAHVIAQHVLRFELAALRLLGHSPSLDACAECGAAVAATGRVPFGHTAGGVLCAACRPGKRNVVSLSAAALATLAKLNNAAPDNSTEIEIDRNLRGELRGLLNHYIAHLVGHDLRMPRAMGEG